MSTEMHGISMQLYVRRGKGPSFHFLLLKGILGDSITI